jgi:type VI secretion system protein ImpE
MTAIELFRAGRLSEAIQVLSDHVRQNPLDTRERTFLFELLCFAGEFDRGEKQLEMLAHGGQQAELGALLYRAALSAERDRQRFFSEKAYLEQAALPPAKPRAGTFNGKSFGEISDADPRIGARLEAFVAGQYLQVRFEHIASLQMQAPKRLRDLLWAPVIVKNGPGFRGRDLGEVLVPVLSPFSWTHADETVRLGRTTVWEEIEGAEVPFGQKMFLVDGEEIPWLELRTLEFTAAGEQSAAA